MITAHRLVRHWAVLAGLTSNERPTVLDLLPHQTAGASILASRLMRWRCAVLADPVGSGKSYTALGAAELYGDEPTIICPAVLVPQWRELLDLSGLGGEVISDGLLSRRPVGSNNRGVVIVDEGHRFRNTNTRRRASLLELVRYRPVLWLTATPVWNTRRDLLALIRVSAGPELFLDAIGCSFEEAWESIDSLDDVWNCVCERFVLRRGSDQGAIRAIFESRSPVVTEEVCARVTELAGASMVFEGEPRELFRRAVARALASSSEAGRGMLERARLFLVRLDEAQRTGGSLSRREFLRSFGLDSLAAQCVLPFWFQPGDVHVPDLARVIAALERAVMDLEANPFKTSEKFRVLVEFLNDAGRTIVFTEYQATAEAIVACLPRRFRPALLTGARCAIPGIGHVDQRALLRAFVNGDPSLSAPLRALVMTPLGAEGLNLQVADTVVHADLPWSHARLEQRVGRADRIGGHSRLRVLSFLPQASLEAVCGVRDVVSRKERLSPVPQTPDAASEGPVGLALRRGTIQLDSETSIEFSPERLIVRQGGDLIPAWPVLSGLTGSFSCEGLAISDPGSIVPLRLSPELAQRTVTLVRAGRFAAAQAWLDCLELVHGVCGDAGRAAFARGVLPPGDWSGCRPPARREAAL